VTNGVLTQLDDIERRLSSLQSEVQELRAAVLAPERPASEPTPTPPPPVPAAAGQRAASQRAARPAAPPPPPPEPREPRPWERELNLPKVELADLLGARALAWAGGIVTLLGVVFFFVLAVNRGWIGPVERVALGALASLLVFGAGLVVRHRYGQLHSAVAAVGAGIAGGYATLLAAAAMYGLVPDVAALAIAAGIAALGTAVALYWNSETVAALGLVGATLVPVAHALDAEISTLGTTFAALMYAATTAVAIRRRWDVLLAAGAVAAIPQLLWLLADVQDDASTGDIVLAAVFWLLVLAAGLARREARRDETESLSTSLILASLLVSGIAARALFEGEVGGLDREGVAFAAVGLTYLVLAAGWFRRDRDLSALLGAIGLAAGAVATAQLLDQGTLAIAFAAEAALVAWVAYRLVEPRYGFLSLGYLTLAVGHLLYLDVPPRELFVETGRLGPDAAVAAFVGLASLAVAFYAPRWKRAREGLPHGFVDELVADLVGAARGVALVAIGVGATLLVHAASLAVLRIGVAAGSFDWGEVAVTALWGVVAAAALVAGRRWDAAEVYGLAWAVAGVAKLVVHDTTQLTDQQAGVAALAFAAPLLAAAIFGRAPIAVGLPPAAAVIGGTGAVAVGGSTAVDGWLLLAVAAPFAALGALRWSDRQLSTALWASSLGLGLAASERLLDHTALVAAWTVAAAALALLAERTKERRLQLASYAFAGLSLFYALTVLAPPRELFEKFESPADGVPAVLLALLALVAVTRRAWDAPNRDGLDEALADAQQRALAPAAWAGALLALYAGSLALLGFSQELGSDVTSAFQRGHTAISALWGIVGLVALYVGLKRGSSSLRLAGFVLLGVSIVKIFLYDLSRLSSVTRALSFLAVGAVLLLAGFFYQRLADVSPRQPRVGAPNGNHT
jgi:uncharacterized membrane protein